MKSEARNGWMDGKLSWIVSLNISERQKIKILWHILAFYIFRDFCRFRGEKSTFGDVLAHRKMVVKSLNLRFQSPSKAVIHLIFREESKSEVRFQFWKLLIYFMRLYYANGWEKWPIAQFSLGEPIWFQSYPKTTYFWLSNEPRPISGAFFSP